MYVYIYIYIYINILHRACGANVMCLRSLLIESSKQNIIIFNLAKEKDVDDILFLSNTHISSSIKKKISCSIKAKYCLIKNNIVSMCEKNILGLVKTKLHDY